MSKLTKKQKEKLISDLLAAYPDAKCALDYGSDFQLLVAVVLSAQTTDVSVNKVTPALFAAAPGPGEMAALGQERLENYIRSIGLYKSKAKNVIALSGALVERFAGQVPCTFDELTSLPGVGRKTANVVMAELFGAQTIAVDTHVFRLANRTGLAVLEGAVKRGLPEKTSAAVLETELQLQKAIPHELWTKMHHALIWHGRLVCRAQRPDCEHCAINDTCKKNGV